MLKNCVKYCDDSLALDPQIRFPNVSDPRHEEATLSCLLWPIFDTLCEGILRSSGFIISFEP